MFMAEDATDPDNGDADVQIGWDRVVQGAHVGNRVILAGKRVVIGYGGVDANAPVTLNGQVRIPGGPDEYGNLAMDGTLVTRHVDGQHAPATDRV